MQYAQNRPKHNIEGVADVLLFEKNMARVREVWGKVMGMERYAPSQVDNPEVARWWATFMQMSASPGDAADLLRMNLLIDIRDILPTIRVPTLILVGDADIPDVHAHAGAIEAGIAGSKRVVIAETGHLMYLEKPEEFTREVITFIALNGY